MTESSTPAAVRIRWGWFFACIVLGVVAIMLGASFTPAAAQWSYAAGVLGNIGTTLLLVGVVLLLERRIIDNAARVVRAVNERSNEALRVQIKDLEDRLAAEWQSATADNVAEVKAKTARLTDEFTQRVVEEATRED